MFEFSWSAKRTIESIEKSGLNLDRLQEDMRLLLYGAKPVATISMSSGFAYHFMKNYPCITEPHIGRGSALVFQNSEIMYQYMTETAKLKQHRRLEIPVIDYSTEDLGLLLGFPPTASKWAENVMFKLVKKDVCKYYDEMRAVYYHGYNFATHRDDVIDSINWMLDNRPIPEEIQTGITVTQVLEVDEKGRAVRKDVKSFEDFKAMNGFVEHN
ncbi:hypothetical protein [Bacillus cereus]|uniref:hypothetical protein n=1 Tax=Bacillus cereus TaxID=1396 RepID=UPI001C8B25D8|nr:hypothetical protein [Bacillus cereus]MBX9158741.1 hypothetical protein [Bacillus cereus]